MRHPATFCFIACALLSAGAFAEELPLAPHARSFEISPEGGHYSEPSVAINPKNPRQIVAVFQGGKNVQGSATAVYSNDGGATFTQAEGTEAPEWRVLGDVTTTFDNAGNAYLCSIAFDKLGTSSYWAHHVGRNGIVVRRSRDGGKTWDEALSNVKTFATGTEPGIQFEDEPRIYADNNPASPYAGYLYVGWVEWQLTQSVMLFSRSTDQAETWSTPIRISTKAGLPRDDNGGLGGYSQATGPDGAIYAAWSDGGSIVLAISRNGGASFAASHSIIPTGPVYFGEVPGIGRVSGFPVLAMDVRKSRGGRLYVSWSDFSNGDVDVFVASSKDHGQTWSSAVRVNDDPVHNGKDQFFQWMAVDPLTGDIYLDFYDRRADEANYKPCVTIARSTDGGASFQNYALSAQSFSPAGAFLGDYTWLDVYANHLIAVWTETTAKASRTNTETIIKAGTADFTGSR